MNLRYLNLDYTSDVSRIPQQLMSIFSKLQVLRMLQCRTFKPEEGSFLSEDAELLMKELLFSDHLNVISLTLNGSLAIQF